MPQSLGRGQQVLWTLRQRSLRVVGEQDKFRKQPCSARAFGYILSRKGHGAALGTPSVPFTCSEPCLVLPGPS